MKNFFIINGKLKEDIRKSKKKLNISSSFSSECGIFGENIFYKKLNSKKITERYSGDYIELWKEYYNKLKQYVDLVEFYGIIQTDSGDIFEMAKYVEPASIIENNTMKWEEFYKIYLKILREINTLIKQGKGKIGIDSSIWNFTVDGKLFDLDPPRLFKGRETTFSNENDNGHYERTFYRNFTEEGMKTNLLATILLAIKNGSINIKDNNADYIEELLIGLIDSFEDKETIRRKIFGDNNKFEEFQNHPIKIIRDILKERRNEKMSKENKTQFIFVTGPSESGKSGAVIHMTKKYPNNVKHAKIRNIFREMYERTSKEKSYEDWYEEQTTGNFEQFWDNYITIAKELGENVDILVMDTLYGVDEMKFIHSRLGRNVSLLYIDAPLQDRISREYTRLRTDSPYSNRKADLTVTMEQIEEQTKKKDEKKRRAGAFDLKKLAINENGRLIINDNAPVHFATVINNNGTLEEFEKKLDDYIDQELYKIRRERTNDGR